MTQKQGNLLSQAFFLTVLFVTVFNTIIARQRDTDTVEKYSFECSAQPDLLQCPRPLLRTLQHYSYIYTWHITLFICFFSPLIRVQNAIVFPYYFTFLNAVTLCSQKA